MLEKNTRILIFLLLCIVVISFCLNVKAEEEEDPYDVGFDVGTELIWEVTELDASTFKIIFGFEPNFEKGDQIKIIIRDVREFTLTYIINYEFWDYKSDWGVPGEEFSLNMYKDPHQYDDYLYCLTPIGDYIAVFGENASSEYTANGNTISKRDVSDIGKDYRWDKEYDIRGVPVVEAYYDEFDQTLVKVEGTFRIVPFGLYFIGFMVAGIIGTLILILRNKRYLINN